MTLIQFKFLVMRHRVGDGHRLRAMSAGGVMSDGIAIGGSINKIQMGSIEKS